ncbi:MAG TPA: hypothetical protein VFU02_10130 [Polyangiaceae bacterium]|nr:hypothetical protein [Polyangiaceae bacterium]
MRRLLLAVALVAPFGLVLVFAGPVADRQASDVARALSDISGGMDLVEPELATRDQEQVARWRAELAPLLDEFAIPEATGDAAPRGARARSLRPPAPQGLFVSADKVLRLARAGVRPAGIPVNAAGPRPAGLLLTGVGGLGVGLQDGDILTHALGRPAVSEEVVVGAILRARGAREPQLSGRVWRDGYSFALVVAQPYADSG